MNKIIVFIKYNAVVITIAVAFITMLIYWIGISISKKALRVAEQEYDDKKSDSHLYLIDCYRWIKEDEPKMKLLLFKIQLTNKSGMKNSYKISLEIEFIRPDNTKSTASLLHNFELSKYILEKNMSIFNSDIRIDENGIESKWLIFKQPPDFFDDYRIEKYLIKAIDNKNVQTTVQSFLIKAVTNEDYKGKLSDL
jgi:hypothetical protein